MKHKRATIKDIAAKLNMNVSTVSRALNDHPSISNDTKKRVWKTAKQLNYRLNNIASNLRRGKGKAIGLLVPRINRQFFSNVINGVETVANLNGYSIVICQSKESFEAERKAIHTLLENRVDGVILSISKETTQYKHIQSILDHHIPIVQFDRIAEELDTHKVINDNYLGGYQAASHLIEQGYQNLLHLAGPQYINIYRERNNGFRQAIEDHKDNTINLTVIEDIITQEATFEVVRILFKQSNPPDAIFAASDFSALGAVLALNELHIDIPEQAGIVGFANEPFTSLMVPSITSLDQFSEEIGRTAANLLLQDMQDYPAETITKTMVIKPKLLIRTSSNRLEIVKQKTH